MPAESASVDRLVATFPEVTQLLRRDRLNIENKKQLNFSIDWRATRLAARLVHQKSESNQRRRATKPTTAIMPSNAVPGSGIAMKLNENSAESP